MRVTLSTYHRLQEAVYEGKHREELMPVYIKFAKFCGTSLEDPIYIKLIEGLMNIEVE